VLSVLQQAKTIRNELDVFTCKDGLVFPVSYTASPIDVDGLITGAVVVFQDITQRKQAEEEREQLLLREQAARTEAQEANRIKDEFLSTVSHELRTPLNAMLGWVQMLRSGKLNEATFARALEIIERNARSQNQLIEDLLDISRIISGKLRLQIRPVELTSVINAAMDSVRLAAEAKAIQLTCELDTSTGLVVGDSERLQQVVWNLMSNAIKFTPKGGHVTVQLERINSHAEITVSDTGQGISPEFLPYIFERFRQADSATTRSHGGLGLGLAIVRHLVELHGGTIHADSLGEGQGATFKVKLPLTALRQQTSSRTKISPTDEPGVPLNGSPQLNGLQVLVVDDEVDARELLTTLLEQRGAFVTAAASVEEALKLIEQSTPDVLVSDIGMPGEDGYALIRQVRARESQTGGRIPAAALTAYARSEDRRQALLAGFQTHLPKPVEPAELIAVVANLSGRTG
jgi:signal transduction histidine kinase/ActR/RegA family two-component response regulator